MCSNLQLSRNLNSQIRSLVQQGHLIQALQLYSSSPLSVSRFTYPSLLKACASLSNLEYGKTLHSSIITTALCSDHYIAASLINMYAKCASFKDALHVFDEMPSKGDVTIWNSIIDGHFRFGYPTKGVQLFRRMQEFSVRPDAYTLCILLSEGNGHLGCLECKQIHAYGVRNLLCFDPFLETALIDAYFRCHRATDALYLFNQLKDKSNVVAWNVMIRGFAENGLWENSLKSYLLAKAGDVKLVSASFTSTVSACSQAGYVILGQQVHCDVIKVGFENDTYVRTSLLTMYAKNQSLEHAEGIFNSIPDKEIELWNAMISAYSANGCPYDALDIFSQMRLSQILPDSFTVSNILSTIAAVEAYDFGRLVHTELVKRPVPSNVTVQSALLTMYAKCGNYTDAYSIFSSMKEPDVVAWSSIISGFYQNEKYKEALEIFTSMEANNVKPDSDIMAIVISVCGELENFNVGCTMHGVVIKNGLEFDLFVGSSLIDMYAKYGFPNMAELVFSSMHHKTPVAWNSMLSCYSRNGLPEKSIALFSQMMLQGANPDSISITTLLVAVASVSVLLKGKNIHGHLMKHWNLVDLQVENSIIDMYIKCGALNYAENVFKSMAEKNLVTWNSMISGYGTHGECLKAMRTFDEMASSRITPDSATFFCLLSSCNHSGLVEEGLNLFKLMETYKIEPKMEHYVNIVDILGRAGLVSDAYNIVGKMPIEASRSIWVSLLWSCRRHGNIELGEMVAEKLIEMEPSRGSNYVQLLNMYRGCEEWEKAAKLRAEMREKGVKKTPGCSWIEVRNKTDVFYSGDCSAPMGKEIFRVLNGLKRNMTKKGHKSDIVEGFCIEL